MKNLLLILAFYFYAVAGKTQTTCNNAVVVNYPITSYSVNAYNNNNYWFRVTLNQGRFEIKVKTHSGPGKITKALVYTGGCGNPNLVGTDSLPNMADSTFTIRINNPNNNQIFRIKLVNSGGPSTFSLLTATTCYIVGDLVTDKKGS